MKLLFVQVLDCERIGVVIRWHLHMISKYSMLPEHGYLWCMQVSNADGPFGNHICDPGVGYFEESRC